MKKTDVFINSVGVDAVKKAVEDTFCASYKEGIIEDEVRSVEDFNRVFMKKIQLYYYENFLNKVQIESGADVFYYEGFCAVCNKKQRFTVDYIGNADDNDKNVDWCNRLVCPDCGCNCNQRFRVRKTLDSYAAGRKVAICERVTKTFAALNNCIPDLMAFEYPGNNLVSDFYNSEDYKEGRIKNINDYINSKYKDYKLDADIAVYDICDLPFADETVDLIIAGDVFGDCFDYLSAFREMYRVLKPTGRVIFTMPFDANTYGIKRLVEEKGGKVYPSLQDWQHGSSIYWLPPMQICHVFGWELLDQLKEIGYADSYGKTYYSISECYMGYLPMYFEAIK